MMRFPLCLLATTLLFLPDARLLNAAQDQLPPGKWQERKGQLQFAIHPKNTVVISSPRHTTAYEVVFQIEARVREEYWMAIQSIKEIEHKPESPRPTGKPLDQAAPSGDSQSPAASPEPATPLRIGWLAPDVKIILSFLQELPDDASEKDATANGTGSGSAPGRKDLRPAPVLETLIFRDGRLTTELKFDPAR